MVRDNTSADTLTGSDVPSLPSPSADQGHGKRVPAPRKVSLPSPRADDQLPSSFGKRVRSLSMDEAEGQVHRTYHTKSAVELPQVQTIAERKKQRDTVAARVAQNRQISLNKMKQARSHAKDKGEKLMQIKSAVFDANEITSPEQSKLAAKVRKQVQKYDLRKAKEAKLAAKNENRRRSISLGEIEFGGGAMRFVEAITDEVTAKERREEYGNKAQRESNTKDNLYHVGREILIFDGATLKVERASIMFLDRMTDEFFFYTSAHTTFRFNKKKGIAGWVYKTGLVVNIDNAYEDERFNKEVDAESGFVTRNILCCPIMCNGNVLAILQFVNKKAGAEFDTEDVKLVKETADRLGQVVADALALL
ncbi:hypothetical protein TL16_g07095 [Triparma laevis f. inornata]|uniref:GAF domain-containing protein n=2 Tax=Triparma laevis TaxID=1534972 RepID=A0A9W7FRL4_9STRA|nr:hypothetical protein TL16_g07095 [Triparma laevis f. inornata]GMI17067.1 hypothetical protein TrLO_g9642 [Triparma laevis f. longispina]